VTVAHMEVPCCWGIVQVVRKALEDSGRRDIPLHGGSCAVPPAAGGRQRKSGGRGPAGPE